MLFSVVVPVYNVADYLPKCMNSLLGQDFDDFEKNPKLVRAVMVIKVTAQEYSCKRNG